MATVELDCPRCGQALQASADTVLGRGEIACAACGEASDLDAARLEAAEEAAARRSFRSTGPATAHRRYRVEVAPIAEIAADPAGRTAPFLATVPALGRTPYALGDSADDAVASLGRIVAMRARASRLPAPLPPSDADPTGRWVEVTD